MARKIKRFFVFLFFSLFFSLLSGRINTSVSPKGKQVKAGNGLSWNSAQAAKQCSPKTKSCTNATTGEPYCC
ncbi:MAG: hypothetical protein IKS41_00830 [Alphaproteobacteria bacterium]|nr:hypothetical protein [Alphaproteobacteria bacterium]